ncbi:class I SAM-dependent methyltransferase [Candidatus Acetothermia bacterium]|nr:class I SAM-dependent methyltransferase [Candidatus Acetothermia bacterium]MBI3660802.1 class I SAM-dependent methyltransferase [Candidatus Acetothermia bacterium]
MNANRLKLYSDLASWWPIFSHPEDYAEEAAYARQTLINHSQFPLRTLLELGSGGGNNASHLKASFAMTLVDLSTEMLAVSRALNPECEHIQGDMRTIRLNRLFDTVFIHDAIMYMTTETDLRKAFVTAYVHCRPGGVALFDPDFVRERFQPRTHHGGHDGENRGVRYLEWIYDPDPADTAYVTDFAYMLREGKDTVHVEYDRHICGLFSRNDWLRWLTEAGFQPEHLLDPWDREIFVAIKPR